SRSATVAAALSIAMLSVSSSSSLEGSRPVSFSVSATILTKFCCLNWPPEMLVAIVLPCLVLNAGGFQRPLANRYDQTGLFCKSDESCRCEDTQIRMPPTQQCFHTDHLTTLQVHLWLVDQEQL